MDTPNRELTPLPSQPADPSNDLEVLAWAAEAHHAAEHNIRVAIARALENPDNTTSEVQKRAPFSPATVTKIARDMGVPPRKPGGHK